MKSPSPNPRIEAKAAGAGGRDYRDAVRNPETMNIAHILISRCLPADLAPTDAVLGTLEMIFTVDSWLEDSEAMALLYRLACSTTRARREGRKRIVRSNRTTWNEFLAAQPYEETTNDPHFVRTGSNAVKKGPKPKEEPQAEVLLTQQELAERWKINVVTLRRWRRSGKIRTIYLGRARRFRLADVLALEQQATA
jgi:excisionase family DNA binding protein